MLLGILTRECTAFQLRGSHPLRPAIQSRSPIHAPFPSTNRQIRNGKSHNPAPCNARRLSHMTRFSLFRVRSPLLTESLLFSLPVGTEMFHFPTFPPTALYIQAEVAGHDSGISRFPYSEIHGSKLVYQLPMAYRRLQRPSSALDAKASTDRP